MIQSGRIASRCLVNANGISSQLTRQHRYVGQTFLTIARAHSTRNFNSVEQVFSYMGKNVVNAPCTRSIQKKIPTGKILFDIEREGRYVVSFKHDEDGSVIGSVKKVQEGQKCQDRPTVKVALSPDLFLKISNREVDSTSALAGGQVLVKGPLHQIVLLKNMMRKAREYETPLKTKEEIECPVQPKVPGILTRLINSTYQTTATWFGSQPSRHYSTEKYQSVEQILSRAKEAANAEAVKDVGAVFQFDVGSTGKFYMDLKNGTGTVDKGEATNPDVTVVLDEKNLLKIFNQELAPATAFMTGAIKVKGNLSQAFALEKFMKRIRG